MPIARNSGGGDFKPAPAGSHISRCIGVISLGTQQPNNPQFSPTFKIMLVWELADELLESGKAMTASREFTCSLSEKSNLRPLLESWRGKPFTKEELDGFDVAQVLDAPCMITVIHKPNAKGKDYAVVSSVSKLPKAVPAKPRVNELVHYEIEDGKNKVFDSLPEWVRKKISSCAEWIEHPIQHDPEPEPEPESPPEDWQPEDEDSKVPF